MEFPRDYDELIECYDSLPPIAIDQMIGRWRGESVPSGHVLDGVLERFGWYGKEFISVNEVHPLVHTTGSGERFFVTPSRIPFRLLMRFPKLSSLIPPKLFFSCRKILTTTKSGAHLELGDFRHVVSAAMVYNKLPIRDHFREVDSSTVLGCMETPLSERLFFFLLKRDEG